MTRIKSKMPYVTMIILVILGTVVAWEWDSARVRAAIT